MNWYKHLLKKRSWVVGFKSIIKNLGYTYLLIIGFLIISNSLSEFIFEVNLSELKFTETERKVSNNSYGLFFKLIQLLLITPIIEELIFRSPIRYSKAGFLLTLAALFYAIIISTTKESAFKWIIICISILIVGYSFFYKKTIEKITYEKWAVIISSIIFGLFHFVNFEVFEIEIWYYYIYKLFPLMILGFFLAKIRLESSIAFCIIAHSIFNIPPFIIKFLL